MYCAVLYDCACASLRALQLDYTFGFARWKNNTMATLEFFNRTIIQCHRSNKVSLGRRRGGKGVVLQTTRLRAVGHRKVDDEVVSVIQPVCKDSCEVSGMVGGDDGVTDHEMRILIHAGAGGGGKAWPCHV